jgi:hypothetical protein
MKKILPFLAAFAALSGAPVTKTLKSDNHTKKCFRKGCDNLRAGNKLYCSVECCKLDKKKQ